MSETIASAAPLAARERKAATLLFADVAALAYKEEFAEEAADLR